MTDQTVKKIKQKDDYTLEELRALIAEMDESIGRQHGKSGKIFEDEEKEKNRLWNNYCSRKSRERRRKVEKDQEKSFMEAHGLSADEDEYGIRPVDERRYIRCFHSGYIDAPVYRKYVQRMTGLSLKQICILQKRTGLIPVPAVGDAEAEKDWKERYERGDIY